MQGGDTVMIYGCKMNVWFLNVSNTHILNMCMCMYMYILCLIYWKIEPASQPAS